MTHDPANPLIVDEARARRLLLAQSLDESDKEGRFVSAVEREQLEREALHAVAGDQPAQAPEPRRYLDERSRRLIDIVRRRDPRLAALEQAEPWQRWLGIGLPLLALLLGAGLERIDNPDQVNMLSPPLLAFLLWNLLTYVVLLLRPLFMRGRSGRGPGGIAAGLRELLGHSREPSATRTRSAVMTRFHLHWWRIAGAVEGWRIARILHLSSAAWAVGVGLSIVLGGLVREYRVGWESTLLDLPQVHTLLSALFSPVVAVLPLEGFTVDDLARMHFRSGAAVGQAEARHWIALYLGLLGLVVVVPRLLLATYAAMRRRWLAGALRIDLAEPYFVELLARVSPARLALAWAAAGPAQREVMRRLWGEAAAEPGDLRERVVPLRTDRGDEMIVAEFVPPLSSAPAEPPPAIDRQAAEPADAASTARSTPTTPERLPARWFGRLQAWWEPAPRAVATAPRTEADHWLVALSNADELATLLPHLNAVPRPVLLLYAGTPEEAALLRHRAEVARLPFEMLPLHDAAGCWAWEEPLRAAIAKPLPEHKQAGTQRLFSAWRTRHEERLHQSMQLLAQPLLAAARDVQAIGSGAVGWRRIVDNTERESSQRAREQAMAALMERLAQAQWQGLTQVRELHGLPPVPAAESGAWEASRFVVRESVHARQAGMAGAASGAAAGAGIDLMTGGLSLGAGAALGALVGGGAAFVAAALKNRSTPGGEAVVQLSDEMLQALCELSLLQYLAVARRGHNTHDVPAHWRSGVVAAVESRRADYHAIWEKARRAPADAKQPGELAGLLASQARDLLTRLRD